MLGTVRARVAGLFVIAGVVLLALFVVGPSASAANVALSGWTQQGGVADWRVQPSGSSVKVVAPDPDFPRTNGQSSFFVSPFNAAGTFKVNLTPNTEADDDYIGFAVGYTAPVNNETCDVTTPCGTQFYLFDWKKATEVEGGQALTADQGGQEGFSLMHVRGARDLRNPDTGSHPACFWTHEDVDNFCEVLGTDFGFQKGYQFGITYTFQITYSASQLKIVLLGSGGNADRTIFDVAAPSGTPYPAGRFAFYNYSQPNTEYSFDDGTTAATSTTTTTGVVPTTLATTPTTAGPTGTTPRPTVGPVTRSTIVRTGPNSVAAMVELVGGLVLLMVGASMTAARGRRPEGVHFQ